MTPDAIKQLRRRLGLTQAALAAQIGAHPSAVAMWEQGKRTPTGLYAAALDRLAGQEQSSMSNDTTAAQLAAIIRDGGFRQVVEALTTNPMIMVAEGWNLTAWEYRQGAGAILFARFDAPKPSPDPELLALNTERTALAQEARALLAASYHDADARRKRDAAQSRLNAIDHDLSSRDPVRIAGRVAKLREMAEAQQRAADRGDNLARWYQDNADQHRAEADALAAELGAMPQPPPREPIEAVLCLNSDRTPELETAATDAPYPVIILWRLDWLPQSGLPVQPGEVPF